MRILGLIVGFAFVVTGCSEKPIVAKYVHPPKVQQAKVQKVTPKRVLPRRVVSKSPMKQSYTPRKIVYRGKITKNFYAFDDYARFRFQRDCDELLFREETLMQDIKIDALSVVDVLADIKTNIRKYRCR